MLVILGCHLDAKLYVRALVLVRQHFPNVVEQRASARHRHVESKLRGHDAGQPGHLFGMLENVLAVARAPAHPADQLDELGMQAVNAGVVGRLLARLDNLRLDLLSRFVDDFFDSPGVDAAVGDELLERQARRLASHGVEAGYDDRIRRVIDDDVDAGGKLEGSNIPALTADDPPFHLVVGERHGRHRALGGVLGCDALNGQRDDLLPFALGVTLGRFTDLANPVGGVGLRLLFHPAHELVLRILRGHARHLLEPAALVAHQPLQLLLAVLNSLFAPAKVTRTFAELFVSLLQYLEFAVEHVLAFSQPALVALDFLPSPANFGLELLAMLDQFFFSRDESALPQIFRFALCLADDAPRCFFGEAEREAENLRKSALVSGKEELI